MSTTTTTQSQVPPFLSTAPLEANRLLPFCFCFSETEILGELVAGTDNMPSFPVTDPSALSPPSFPLMTLLLRGDCVSMATAATAVLASVEPAVIEDGIITAASPLTFSRHWA